MDGWLTPDPGAALGLRADSDYASEPTGWSHPWSTPAAHLFTVAAALLVGFLLVAGIAAARNAAVARDDRKSELIELIHARQQRAEALAGQLETLRAEVADAERSTSSAGTGFLNASLTRTQAAAGLTGLRGPGLRVTFGDAKGACPTGRPEDCRIQDVDLQLAVNTLFGSGAEAVAVNGERVIATTAIRSAGTSILVNYRVLTSPYVVEAIGEPQSLAARLADSELGSDFAVWRDEFGLGFASEPVEELLLPPYAGPVRLESSPPPVPSESPPADGVPR